MSKNSILIIDDDETILAIVEKILEQNGFSVVTTTSGAEGLSIVHTVKPDGIVLDIKMPEMDGIEVLTTLKSDEKTKNIPVIMMTAKNDIGDVSQMLKMGAKDYIVKPFDHDNFIVRIRNMLRA